MDISSLQRELDSLRGYRDVLHDTMKGLVAQAQGKITPSETPELVQLLQQVAELLAEFTANAKEASSQPQIKSQAADAAADKYDTLAREEAAREKALREKAEAEIQRLERESTIAAENLATAEKQRDFATKQLSSQRLARKQLEAVHSLLEAEASALDAALSRLAASEQREKRSAYAAMLTTSDADAEQRDAERERALAAAAAASEALAEAKRVATADAAARAEAEASLAASRAELAKARRELQGSLAETDRKRTEAFALSAEVQALKRRVKELEEQQVVAEPPPPQQPAVPPPPQQRSAFSQYVESLDERTGKQRPSPRQQLTAAAFAPSAAAEQSPRPPSAGQQVLRSARERGGSMLERAVAKKGSESARQPSTALPAKPGAVDRQTGYAMHIR